MNPCKACIKAYATSPCATLNHCAFEGTDEQPSVEAELRHASLVMDD